MKIKICSHCKKELPISLFFKNKYAKDGLNYYCRDCRSKIHFAQKEKSNKLSRDYYYNHKKERLEKARTWKANHKEYIQRYNKEYKQKNYEKIKPRHDFNNKLRKIRIRNLGGTHTLEQWEDLKCRYEYICPSCLRKEPEIKLTEDHMIPGKVWKKYIKNHPEITYEYNDMENIQPLCASCNSSKLTKVIKYLEPSLINLIRLNKIMNT